MFMGKLFVVFIALLGLAGCSQEEPPSKAEAPRTELAYASTKDIRNINPHLYSGEMAAQNMVFEPLVVNTKEGVKPWLAESWEISPDAFQRRGRQSEYGRHSEQPSPARVAGHGQRNRPQ